jgi:hypothetical protein
LKPKIACLIAALAALVFVIITSRTIIKSVWIQMNGVVVESTVLHVSTFTNKSPFRSVTVSFKTPDGSQVTAKASSLQHLSSGNMIKIWYNPADPQEIDFGDDNSYNMRGFVISGLLFVFFVFFLIRYSLKDKANKKLISSGKKIPAEFVSVDRNEKYRMGDKNPWVIKCKWTDDRNNKDYYFLSKNYTVDPAQYLKGRNHIDVFIDPADPGKYYMDTSFMPKGNISIG